LVKSITPTKIWNLYQKYDYLGKGERYKYKFLIFRDQDNPYRTQGEMAIDNAITGNNIESVSMQHISKKKFLDLIKRIIKKRPRDVREWLS